MIRFCVKSHDKESVISCTLNQLIIQLALRAHHNNYGSKVLICCMPTPWPRKHNLFFLPAWLGLLLDCKSEIQHWELKTPQAQNSCHLLFCPLSLIYLELHKHDCLNK